MNAQELTAILKQTPATPGVYTWHNKHGKPLYIGKALNLKSRLLSYRKPLDVRIATMVQQAESLTWEKTNTDIEALILESQLIKREKPAFNIMWRDDKRYFYVEFTRVDFPRVVITHQPSNIYRLRPNFIGPFTEGVALRAVLRALRRIFPYCTCLATHHLRCLNAHIGKCPGYCCLKTPATATQKKEYARTIRAIKDVLTGRRDAVVRKLAHENPDIALKLLRVFQNARINRAHLEAPHRARLAKAPAKRVEGYDVANIGGQYAVGAMVVFTDGIPNKKEYRLFNIKTTGGDTDMLRELLDRRLKHKEWPLPDLIVVDGGKAQLNVAKKVISNQLSVASSQLKTGNRKLETIPIIAVTKDDHHRAIKTIGARIDQKLAFAVDAEAHRFAISHYRRRYRKSVK